MSADRPDPEPVPPATDPAHLLLDRLRSAPAPRPRRRRTVTPEEASWSGAGPDDRDPATLSASLEQVVERQNWRRTLDEVSLAPRWAAIVGDALAEHSRPDTLVGGELTVIAASSAWATQIRLMSRTVLARIAAEVGPGIVERVRVVGPRAPDWRHGQLRVKGRGPRDTYG